MTLTVNGKRYTGKQIARLMDKANMTNGGDYIVVLNGWRYFANFREIQDAYFAPTCSAHRANAIALAADDGTYTYSIWLAL
jgi:hypothetical protein